MANLSQMDFITSNPAVEAYQRGQREDLRNEGSELSNQYNRASMPSRLRTVEAGADTAESNARVLGATEADRISQTNSGARSAAAGADVAESGARTTLATEGDRIRTSGANADIVGATRDVAVGTVPSRIRTTNAGADTAEAGATTAGSNARTTVATEPYRIDTSAGNSRLATAHADVADSNARVSGQTEPARVRAANAGANQAEAAAVNATLQSVYKQIDLLRAGQIEAAHEVARQSGHQIPEALVGNTQLQASVAALAQRAKELYPNRPRDQAAYLQAGIQRLMEARQQQQQNEANPEPGQQGRVSLNDPTAPYTVPDAPQPPETAGTGNNRYQAFPGRDPATGQEGTVIFDRQTGQQRFEPGNTITSRAGANGRGTSVFEQKRSAWLAVHPGDNEGALQYAQGHRQLSAVALQQSALRMATTEINGNTLLRFSNQQQRSAAINQRAQEILQQLNAANQPQAAAPAPAAQRPDMMTPGDGGAPVNAQIPQRPPTVPPGSAYSPSRQMWRDGSGNVYDAQGTPVQQ